MKLIGFELNFRHQTVFWVWTIAVMFCFDCWNGVLPDPDMSAGAGPKFVCLVVRKVAGGAGPMVLAETNIMFLRGQSHAE